MSEMGSNRIEIRLYGHVDIVPGKIKIQYTTKILNAIERAAIACAKELDPLVDEKGLILSLDSLRVGSQRMGLAWNDERLGSGLGMLLTAAREKRLSTLPNIAQKQLLDIQQVQKKLDCDISFYSDPTESAQPIAIFSRTQPFQLPKPIRMKDTTVRGRILRVGGKEPSLGLDLMNGDILSCSGKQSVIQELGGYLYQNVLLRGTALVDGITLKKSSFEIESFNLWQTSKASESFRLLREEFGHHFDEIQDVDAHTRAKRSEDLESSQEKSTQRTKREDRGTV